MLRPPPNPADAPASNLGTRAGILSRPAARTAGQIAIGLFGKHRKSPEHILDLGGSAELTEFKDFFYERGIRVAIDQNVWRDLDGEAYMPFNHVMVAQRNGATLVARIAASRDELRRADFPIVVAAAQPGGSIAAVPVLFELVRATLHDAARADSLQLLHESVAMARRFAIESPPPRPHLDVSRTALGELAGKVAFGLDGTGLIKVLYQMDRQMPTLMEPIRAMRTEMPLPPVHMRLPAVASWPVESAALWVRFFTEQTNQRRPPILAFADAASRIVDVFVGTPSPAMLRCLRTSPVAMPDVTHIPYEIDSSYQITARQQILDAMQAAPRSDPPEASQALPQISGGRHTSRNADGKSFGDSRWPLIVAGCFVGIFALAVLALLLYL